MVDLAANLKLPCVADVKLGSKPYNPKKMERQNWKISSSSSSTHGFRLCGYSNYHSPKICKFVNKYTCRSISGDLIEAELASFFSDQQGNLRKAIVQMVVEKAKAIHAVIEQHSQGLKLYGCSLLVLYCA